MGSISNVRYALKPLFLFVLIPLTTSACATAVAPERSLALQSSDKRAEGSAVQCNANPTTIQRIGLLLVNQARENKRWCGLKRYSSTTKLQLNRQLERTSYKHAQNMATQNYFSHVARDGSNVGDRATQAGYAWRNIGENIAAGQQSLKEVIDAWVASPSHCKNIMNPAFTEMGLSCVSSTQGNFKHYWVHVFGATAP